MNNEMIKVKCLNLGKSAEVPAGSTLDEVAKQLDIKLKYSILGAAVNNKYVGLTYRIYRPKQILFFDITHHEGLRTYTRTLILMLYAAVRELMPEAKLTVLHSVSNGIYCELHGPNGDILTTAETEAIKARMHEFQQQAIPIIPTEEETAEAAKEFEHLPAMADLIRQHSDIYTTVHHMGKHSAVMYSALAPNTRIIDVFDLVPYYKGMLLQLPNSSNPEQVSEMIRQDKMFATFVEFDRWQKLMHVQRLADLNSIIEKNRGREIIQVAEALHEKKISDIAAMIAERRESVKIVLIAGPSSSGKTTFGKRLAVHLMVNGINPVNLSLDNYFVNREDTPRDENGDYDFEAVEAIDVKLFNEQLLALTHGEEVEIPKFDFTTGSRTYDGERLKMGENHVLIIEGTHGLTPQLTYLIPKDVKFGIYVCPLVSINFDSLTRINTTDNRLIRRIVRDYKYRGYSAEETIARWPSVRRGEKLHIYPNQEQADVVFNSALLYELTVLKAEAVPVLLQVAPNSPHYAEARRLLRFLSFFRSLSGDTIPPTSIMREFVGGSSFKY